MVLWGVSATLMMGFFILLNLLKNPTSILAVFFGVMMLVSGVPSFLAFFSGRRDLGLANEAILIYMKRNLS
jgi:uncharacterized membrane protein HdeD (DUF308 family)